MSKDFAVIKLAGVQRIVTKGEEITVNKLNGNVKDKISFDEVLLINKAEKAQIGTPNIKGAKVEAIIVDQLKGPKVRKRTFKAKSRYHKHIGHRQLLTKLQITSIK